MKRLLLMACSLFLGIQYMNAQQGQLNVTIAAPSASVSAVPNDQITLNLNRTGEPIHNCIVYYRIMYTFSYKLINQATSQVYNIGEDYLYANGWSCYPTIQWHEGTPTTTAKIPCNIPTGSYWLSIEMKDVFSSGVNNGGYTIPNTNPYTGGMGSYSDFQTSALYVSSFNQATLASTTQGAFHQSLNATSATFPNLMTVNVTNTNPFDVNVTTGANQCLGTAAGNVVSGGVAPLSYEWQSLMGNSYPMPAGPGSSNTSISGLYPGLYNMKVTDANGCFVNKPFQIANTEMQLSATQVNSTCFPGNGSIDLSIAAGTAPYTYNWSNGASTQDISGLPLGGYTVSVTDAANCTRSLGKTITDGYQHYDYPNGLTISAATAVISDVVPDGIIRIKGLLVIESGTTYTINSKTFEFAEDPALYYQADQGYPSSGIVVKDGATLNLTNSTLRGITGCNSMWSGVEIWGDPSSIVVIGTPQIQKVVFNESQLNNGKLVLKNSTIRDAHTAVSCYRTNVPYLASTPEYGRGILQASGSSFINNAVNIDFKSTTGYNINNLSTINRCTFTSSAALINAARYGNEPTNVFIRMNRTHGVKVTGNTFTGTTSYAAAGKVNGIVSYNASYQVIPSTEFNGYQTNPVENAFKSLFKGVDIYSVGGTNQTIKVRGNKFEGVYQGVTANSSNFDEMSLNTFTVPQGTSSQQSWGIFLSNSTGFLATENTFKTTVSSNPFTFGLISRNTASSAGQVYKNVYPGNFNAGSQAEQNNTKLQIQCNTYTGNNNFDWAVTSGQLANQGSCLSGSTSANNIFGTCSGSASEQINLNSTGSAFQYFSSANTLLACVSSGVSITNCTYAPVCPTKITPAPCYNCPVAGLATAYDNASGLEKEILRTDLLRDFLQNEDTKSFVDLLEAEKYQEDLEILVPFLWAQNDFYKARQALNSLVTSDAEKRAFNEFYDLVISLGESGRTTSQLKAAEMSMLKLIAGSTARISETANALLAMMDNTTYSNVPERAVKKKNSSFAADEEAGSEAISMHIYPNPSSTFSTIRFGENQSGKLFVFSMTGQLVQTSHVDNQQELMLHTGQWENGIYLVVFENSNGKNEQQKLTITQ